MISKDANSTIPAPITGTLSDYFEDVYRPFLEVSDATGSAKSVLLK